MKRSWGLLSDQLEPVSLKDIVVSLSINDFVAAVSATLNYENEDKEPLEAFFALPLDEHSAIFDVEIVVDGKKFVTELEERKDECGNFFGSFKNGNALEEEKYSKDDFCCNVGDLQPGSKVALTLRYVQELSLEANGAVYFQFPAILNPQLKYSDLSTGTFQDVKIPTVPLEKMPCTLSMVATIRSQHGIEKINSNCSLTPIEYLGDDKTSVQVSLADGHRFDQDMELWIHFCKVHSPSVTVEMGMPERNPESLMGAPCAMVRFYPNIPEVEPSKVCGEFVFLMDQSRCMKRPMNKHENSQSRIEVAKEALILLLRSLPAGCYFNVYGFGHSGKALFQKSVKYTQRTMEKALKRVKLMSAEQSSKNVLESLQKIYKQPSIPGHPMQLFIFTYGKLKDPNSIMEEIKIHSKKHRCFTFGIGDGASTNLINSIAYMTGGSSEFLRCQEKIQFKTLRSLKLALQSAVEDLSLSWNLPPGLSVMMLSPEQSAISKGQRMLIYAQLTGVMPAMETTGEICLKYTFQGMSFKEKVTFSLQPMPDENYLIHRLAAKSLLHSKDFGDILTPYRDQEEVMNISLESGVISSFTAFVVIHKELNKSVQWPLSQQENCEQYPPSDACCHLYGCPDYSFYLSRVIPWPLPLSTTDVSSTENVISQENGQYTPQDPGQSCWKSLRSLKRILFENKNEDPSADNNLRPYSKAKREKDILQLIHLQKANGSWALTGDLAKLLGLKLKDIRVAHPVKNLDSSAWATVLVVLWLHVNGKDLKWEWELLEWKARAWLRDNAGSETPALVQAANVCLNSSVDPSLFAYENEAQEKKNLFWPPQCPSFLFY